MNKRTKRQPDHRYLFKAQWRGTALRFYIDADDIEYAYKKAERAVMKMLGGSMCLSIDCVKIEY